MKINQLLIALLAVISLTNSCSKERIEPEKNKYTSMDEYFDSKKQEEQEYLIDSTGNNPLIGKEGTKIWLNKSCFNTEVEWPYTIKLVELYTPKDFIYYQISSQSGNIPLRNHGAIRLRAYKNETELSLNNSKSWMVEMPYNSPRLDMSTYYGSDQDSDVDWSSSPSALFDTSSYGYAGYTQKLGWLGAMKNESNSATGSFSFTSETDELQNLSIIVYLTDLEVLTEVRDLKSIELPIGSEAKIILMGMADGKFYHDYFETTVANSTTEIEVAMEEISEANLTALLDAL